MFAQRNQARAEVPKVTWTREAPRVILGRAIVGGGGKNVATIRVIPKVAFLLIVMPFLLFALVLWAPVRRLILP